MLLAEYDYETDIAVQRAEEREIAFAQGISQGVYQEALETAKILKQLGDSVKKNNASNRSQSRRSGSDYLIGNG